MDQIDPPATEGLHPNSRVNCWRSEPPTEAARRKRDARVREGEAQRLAEQMAWPGPRVTHSEMMLPILQLLDEAGQARPVDLYDALVNRLGLDPAVRCEVQSYGEQSTVLFDRAVRWTLQEGKRQGLMAAPARGRWQTTDAGAAMLGRVRPGYQITIFRTNLGRAVAALAQEASSVVDADSLKLLFTSPLFPLVKGKEYGRMTPAEWLPWMMDLVGHWLPLVKQDGCLAIHVGQCHYRGTYAVSSYRERFVIAAEAELGLYHHQDFFWLNNSRKAVLEWGGKRKVLPHNVIDPILVFSKSSMPRVSVKDMKRPYANPDDPRMAAPGEKEIRRSGLDFGPNSYRDRGGAMPTNLIIRGPQPGNDAWSRAVEATGMKAHPCPMPLDVPTPVIQWATGPGELVGDFFFGSGATGAAAEALGRRWIGLDHYPQYLDGAALRPEFVEAPGYEWHRDRADQAE